MIITIVVAVRVVISSVVVASVIIFSVVTSTVMSVVVPSVVIPVPVIVIAVSDYGAVSVDKRRMKSQYQGRGKYAYMRPHNINMASVMAVTLSISIITRK